MSHELAPAQQLPYEPFAAGEWKVQGKDLIEDRTKCIRAGLHLVQYSFNWCKSMPLRHKLSGYTLGTCGADPASETRVGRAGKWMKEHPAPVPEKVERFAVKAKR